MSVTSVTLGTFFSTSDGKTVLGGAGGSGLDTKGLVSDLVNAKSLPITQDRTTIKANTDQITALNTFNTLLSNFQSAADALRNPPGINNIASNVFAFTTASVGNGGSPYVSVTTTAGAANQSYNISDIQSVATNATQSSGVFSLASANADATVGSVRFNPGTINFARGGSVTVAAGDSLNTIAANFNAASAQSGISASVIQVDATHFQLSFTATATGTNANFDLNNVGTVTSGSAVLSSINLGAAAIATNADFKISGVHIIRQSNTVNDAINGLTINILQPTPDNTTNYPVTISPDRTTVQNTIVRFVSSYNALKSFEAQQTKQNTDGTFASTALLATNQAFRQTMSAVTTQILVPGAGLTGALTSLSDLGITLTNQTATDTLPAVTGILNVDDTKLTSLLASNYQAIKNVFGFNLTSDNTNLAVFAENKPLGTHNFTINIAGAPGAQTFTASYTLNSITKTVNLTAKSIGTNLGFSLDGPAGSELEGLQLIYASTANATESTDELRATSKVHCLSCAPAACASGPPARPSVALRRRDAAR